jgi:hypothetical protein
VFEAVEEQQDLRSGLDAVRRHCQNGAGIGVVLGFEGDLIAMLSQNCSETCRAQIARKSRMGFRERGRKDASAT